MSTEILAILSPVFGVILIGFVSASFYDWRAEALKPVNNINLNILLPIFIFSSLQSSPIDLNNALTLGSLGALIMVLRGIITLPLLRFFGQAKLVMPPIMFNNSGNMGIPISLLAFGDKALVGVIILFLVENTLHFSIGRSIMQGSIKWRDTFLNPMIVAAFLGGVFNLSELTLPAIAQHPLDLAGQTAIPLLLFTLGVKMRDLRLDFATTAIAFGIWVPIAGLLSLLIIKQLPVSATHLDWQLLTVFALLPPALLNYLMAEQLQVSPSKMAALVLYANLIAPVPLAIAFYYIL